MVSFVKLGLASEASREFAEAILWYEKGLAMAKKSDKPEFFKDQVEALNTRITSCKAALEKKNKEK